MKANAVPQADVKSRIGLALCALVAVGLISALFAGSALAAPIAKNGKVNACYKVKGKAKGAMRVVPANKKCRKGERKLAWSVAGTPGPSGQDGAKGANGANGATGATGAPGAAAIGNEAALQAKIAGLTVKVEGLEGILAGVTNGDLLTTVNKLTGITGLELSDAVGTLPVVNSLCSQTTLLTSQLNLVQGGVAGLGLNGVLTGLGGLLNIPSLPALLTAYTCPS